MRLNEGEREYLAEEREAGGTKLLHHTVKDSHTPRKEAAAGFTVKYLQPLQ